MGGVPPSMEGVCRFEVVLTKGSSKADLEHVYSLLLQMNSFRTKTTPAGKQQSRSIEYQPTNL